MRWIARTLGLASILCGLAGCAQQCFVKEADLEHYNRLMPPRVENDPQAGRPLLGTHERPATVLDPERREPWHLTLAEAIAIALENGTTGIQSVRQPGQIQDDLLTFGQLQQIGFSSDKNRVLALNPAIDGAAIEGQLARFDPIWTSAVNWRFTDQQVQGLASFQNGQGATLFTGLAKPLPTGGVAGITFQTDYTNLAQPPTAFPIQNPAYLARFGLHFDHPLLRGFGTDINQLLAQHPGLSPGTSLGGFGGAAGQFLANERLGQVAGNRGFNVPGGILLARVRFDQSRAEFERIVNYKLLNVEWAYWNLYNSYINLYAAEQGMRLARDVWERTKAKARIGAGGAKEGAPTEADAQRAEGQYQLFRGDRIAALDDVLEKERILRRLMGLTGHEDRQIIPIDAPTLAPYHPNFEAAVDEALTLRPELVAAREQIKLAQFDLYVQKNNLLPDLRFTSNYEFTGLGSEIGGNGQVFDAATGQFRSSNAFRNLANGDFANWNLGLVLNVPLGYRFEHAQMRRARLQLAQATMALKNEEDKAISFLKFAYRQVIDQYELIKIRRAQRISFSGKLKEAIARKRVGLAEFSESTLQAQRDWVTALNQEYQAITKYNQALAMYQFAKGTLLKHNNVVISEGPLPECAQVRAVEHERERAKALLLRERANAVPHVACGENGAAIPVLPYDVAPSVPALTEGAKMPVADVEGTAVGNPQPLPAAPSWLPQAKPTPAEVMLPEVQGQMNAPAAGTTFPRAHGQHEAVGVAPAPAVNRPASLTDVGNFPEEDSRRAPPLPAAPPESGGAAPR